jgi:hypothetical protein
MASHLHDMKKDWEALVAAGIPLEPLEMRICDDAKASATGLTLRLGSNVGRRMISEVKPGFFVYVIPVFIRCDGPGKKIICDAWIGTPWPDTNIQWFDDPRGGEHPWYYQFPGQRFRREEVLNHRIKCVLSRGDIREGLLLALGSAPPDEYKHRDKANINLTLVDQWDGEHKLPMQVTIYRGAKGAKPISSLHRRNSPLLSRRDVIPPPVSRRGLPERVPMSREKEEEIFNSIFKFIETQKK